MPTPFARLVLLATLGFSVAACNPAHDFASDGADAPLAASAVSRAATVPATPRIAADVEMTEDVACPCFRRSALANQDQALTSEARSADFYLFFDTFNYFGLDRRRTEARALVSTSAGPLEEVAAVYITPGSEAGDLHLACYRQEVVTDPHTGAPGYAYRTIEPSVAEAEACRRAIYDAIGDDEPCQGPACGLPYTKDQLDPDYPPYNDGNRAPAPLHESIQRAIAGAASALAVEVAP